DVLTVGINRAVSLLADAKPGRGRTPPLKVIGNHPADEKPIELYSGRYGPYIKHGKINATVPKEIEPTELTLERAVELIAERAAKTGAKAPKAKKATKKATKPAKPAN